MLPHLLRAGEWFARSGIQAPNGGVARYYRTDLRSNYPVSTEITGYGVSAFVYLHACGADPRYLEHAVAAARFLTRTAWDSALEAMPFELEPAQFTYFFDCGIIVRGLLAAWRASGEDEFRGHALMLGRRMAADFASDLDDLHPILSLPARQPLDRDPQRWSRSPGCYQLKAAMAWWDLYEVTGDRAFLEAYERTLEFALANAATFLPGHADPLKVMDRLHAFLYFLEGLLPRAAEPACAAAIRDGIARVAQLSAEIAPRFLRSDVLAQLLRMRFYADAAGAAPLDRAAAASEAAGLAEFQANSSDPRIDGGFYFGRKGADWLPYVNPVSTAFAMQALALAQCHAHGAQPNRHLLI